MNSKNVWQHPYKIDPKYKTKVAYFCMEYAIDQSLKIYSGGLGFLAGSHLRSAYELKQNFVAIGMLWKYGYYDQMRNDDRTLRPQFIEKSYSFLEDTGIVVSITVNNHRVYVKAFYLPPDLFGTAPLYLLTTDIPENDHLARTITNRLYDDNIATRVAQSIVLGIGGGKVIEALGGADIYHINEGHALPLASYLYEKYNQDLNEVKKHFVFTTHTPEKAGNEEHDAFFLNQMGFFNRVLTPQEIQDVTDHKHNLNYTVSALRMSKLANGVSKLHGEVSREMWKEYGSISPIISITNAQNAKYWKDDDMYKYLEKNDEKGMIERKKELKSWLFRVVADQTGKLLDPDVLTIVWARRFAAYKRADLLLNDIERFKKLVNRKDKKVQIIWAGKPYPTDVQAVSVFNHLVIYTQNMPNCAVLTGYELRLSKLLKGAADIWLNTPRRPREASGTSGMTSAMNGGVNFSTYDGWVCEFVEHGKNGFIIPPVDESLPIEKQDMIDCENMYDILEKEIIPAYYDDNKKWMQIVKNSMQGVIPAFESGRMADEYYRLLYNI
jgi:starch phosphorylase